MTSRARVPRARRRRERRASRPPSAFPVRSEQLGLEEVEELPASPELRPFSAITAGRRALASAPPARRSSRSHVRRSEVAGSSRRTGGSGPPRAPEDEGPHLLLERPGRLGALDEREGVVESPALAEGEEGVHERVADDPLLLPVPPAEDGFAVPGDRARQLAGEVQGARGVDGDGGPGDGVPGDLAEDPLPVLRLPRGDPEPSLAAPRPLEDRRVPRGSDRRGGLRRHGGGRRRIAPVREPRGAQEHHPGRSPPRLPGGRPERRPARRRGSRRSRARTAPTTGR